MLFGTDSHTCTAGAFGEFATGIGNTDAGFVMGTGKLWVKVPPTMRFVFHGELPPYLMAKDLILAVIGDIGCDGATYRAMEFDGDGVYALNIEERMTLCNMVIEAGGKNGVIAPDQVTLDYVNARNKHGIPYTPVYTDSGEKADRYGRGLRSSHCQNVRRGSRATMPPPRIRPASSTRRATGPRGSVTWRTLTSPSLPVRPSVSTRMPGLVTRVRSPPIPRSTSICKVSWVISASVKSSFTSPAVSRISIRRGTTQRPLRVTSPKRWSIRTMSLACRWIPLGGRSAVRTASSLLVRADSAASRRSSSSAAVSRPSPAAALRISATRSRSAWDALSSGSAPGS